MKIEVKNYYKLITGCIVEGDWVEMKKEYFDALDVQGEAPKEEKAPRLSLSKILSLFFMENIVLFQKIEWMLRMLSIFWSKNIFS